MYTMSLTYRMLRSFTGRSLCRNFGTKHFPGSHITRPITRPHGRGYSGTYPLGIPNHKIDNLNHLTRRGISSSAVNAQNIPPGRRVIRTRAQVYPDLNPRVWLVLIITTGGAIYYIAHLEQIPETGRWRFIDVDKNQEKKLAKAEHKAFLEEYKGKIIPPTDPTAQQIAQVVARLLEANSLGILKPPASNPLTSGGIFGRFDNDDLDEMSTKDTWDPDLSRNLETSGFSEDEDAYASSKGSSSMREWNLIVVNDDKIVNAAAGHGNIIVFTGILPVARDEQGLAAVLSHEIAHVVLRHVAERLSSILVANFAIAVLSILGIDMGLGSILMQYLYSLPNSRTQELEADKIGMRLAARACFNPRAAIEMHSRLTNYEKLHSRGMININLDFLRTHPTGERRIELLQAELPEALSIRAASSECANLQDDYDAFREAASAILEEQIRI